VFLNEQSELQISTTRRDIQMLHGEALFEVTHDPRRVWTVHSGNADIQVLGTQFDVYQRSGPTRVAVVEGAVQINIAPRTAKPSTRVPDPDLHSTPPRSSESRLEVRAGQVAQANDQEVTQVNNVGVSEIVDWHHAELLVDRWPLATVAEKFNLDNVRQLRIADPAVAQLPIRGRFKTDRPERLVQTLQHLYPELPVRETNEGWVVGTQAGAR
jgi:transmembrane sensor